MPLHPQVKRVIEHAYHQGHGELWTKSLAEIRQYYQNLYHWKLAAPFEEIALERGGPTLRLHYPQNSQSSSLPVVIYFRASAYVLGSLDDTNYFGHFLANHLNCVVAAVEIRLSPEAKFPIPFQDGVRSIEYLYEHHRTLKIDQQKIALWGESSGGNIAAGLSDYFSKLDKKLIKCQVLFYPMLDYYRHYPSKTTFATGYLMDQKLSDWFMKQYLTCPKEVQDIRVSPLLAQNFAHLPPTILIGAQYDPMHDEAVCYINELKCANVEVDALFMPGMTHGFLGYAMKLENSQFAQKYAAKRMISYLAGK